MGVVMPVVVLATTFLLLYVQGTRAASDSVNSESYDVTLIIYSTACAPRYYIYCYNWWSYSYYWCFRIWGIRNLRTSCDTRSSTYCYTAISFITVSRKRCKLGQWMNFPKCDIPICASECRSPQACVRPNECGCPGQPGSYCTNVKCTDQLNCYPGTCDNHRCKCPPGFAGENCQQLELTPDIRSCSANVYGDPEGTERVVSEAKKCAAEGLDEAEWETNWIGRSALKGDTGASALKRFVATWDVEYANRRSMPDKSAAEFIQNAPVRLGIVQATYTISLRGATREYECTGRDINEQDPGTRAICESKSVALTQLGVDPQHKDIMLVRFNAKLGGEKRGEFPSQKFTGNSSTRTMKFQFDFAPPTHCAFQLKINQSHQCDSFPITLNESITTNPKIEFAFNDWTDDGSGIDRFQVDIYFLKPDHEGVLQNVGSPTKTDYVRANQSSFIYDCHTTGTYSIELTVYDKAGNVAKVRKIFTYNNQPSIRFEQKPFYIDAANPDTNYQFITNTTKTQGDRYQFTARWPGLFVTTLDDAWKRRVKRWPRNETFWLDDVYGARFGVRSTDAIGNQTAVQLYQFAFAVDSVGGVGAQEPDNFTLITDTTKEEHSFSVPKDELPEGSTIVMWLRAYDLKADLYKATSMVSLHTSRNDMALTKKPTFEYQYKDLYTTAIVLELNSSIAGVRSITYEAYDKKLNVKIANAEGPAKILTRDSRTQQSSNQEGTVKLCEPADTTCYCIPLGYCYEVAQVILIDNCLIDKHAGNDIEIRFKITARSGHSISNSVTLEKVSLDSIPCRSHPLSGGVIFAIIICVLILLVLLIILIVMFMRWRQHKHPVPQRFRSMMSSIHNRINHNTENELYGSAPDPRDDVKPMKYKNNVNKAKLNEEKTEKNEYSSDPDVKHMKEATRDEQKLMAAPNKKGNVKLVTSKNLQVADETLGEGRFALVRKADWQQGNKTVKVAVKALRSGYSKSDVDTMNEKIQFMSKLPTHVNLVNYLGTYQEDGTGAAPAMLLDFCDTPLTEWLTSTKNIYEKYQNPEILENTLTFSLNIARGMEHLHSSRIIHRRLSAKNVLLVNSVNGIIAKLIGFGPSKDDGPDEQSQSGGQAVVKVKWLAPETLASLKSKSPVYDEKTDIWSYGVTMWEIYSKGDPPYADMKSSEVQNQLKSGYTLSCPKDCAPELFQGVMLPCWNLKSNQRPSFEKICSFIEQFRRGEDTQGQGYYGTDDLADKAPEGYYAAEDLHNDSKDRRGPELYDDAR